jgi:hypothetical protein
MFLAALMFVPLLAAGIAYLLWSAGLNWPIRDRKLLAQTVIGTAGVERMPPKLSLLLKAVFMLAAGVAALALADDVGGGPDLTLAGALLGLAFLARGVVGLTGWWQARTPEPAFRFNDRRVYTPASLALGAGFLNLVAMRLP